MRRQHLRHGIVLFTLTALLGVGFRQQGRIDDQLTLLITGGLMLLALVCALASASGAQERPATEDETGDPNEARGVAGPFDGGQFPLESEGGRDQRRCLAALCPA